MTETIILRRHYVASAIASQHRLERLSEEHRPRWLTCTYEAFLAHLRRVHGDGYLQRPDGTPLQPRKS